MEFRVLLVIILCIPAVTLAIFIPSSNRDFRKKIATVTPDSKYSDLLRDLAVIKLRLESISYDPLLIDGPPMTKSLPDEEVQTEDPPASFNEMEVLELVPVIIEQKRRGNVSPDEELTLKEIFGDLWIVIEEEANRSEIEEMNPILKALLQSHDLRLKRALVQHQPKLEPRQHQRHRQQKQGQEQGLEVEEQNDIFGNSVDRVRVTRWPKAFMDLSELSPQQRLIRRAAFLIRQWFDENPTRNPRNQRNRLPAKKVKKNKRGSNRRRGRNNNHRGGAGARRRKNLRPKRHNTDIYVDDNHAGYDYEDFGDYFTIDDMMTKPRSMRSSIRTLFNEYDSMEDEEDDDVIKFDNEEDYE